MKSIGVAIITHNAEKHLPKCLPPYLESPLKPRVLVVNSSSPDRTVPLAEEMGAETLVIPRKEFNHGTTRERARKHLATDIVVMATPDAYAQPEALEKLIAPLNHTASVAYARQIPHENANFFESFSRAFNYSETGHIRSLEDRKKYGVYTYFCSNACAAYDQNALDSIGGFQEVLIGEDTLAVAKLLSQGHKIAYAADAVVRHSHRYSLADEFRRHFDTGLYRSEHQELLQGSDACRGKAYVKEMMARLAREKPHLLPYAGAQTLAKWLGYRLGRASTCAPRWWKRLLSSQDFYW